MHVSLVSAEGDRRSVNSMCDVIMETDVRPFFIHFISFGRCNGPLTCRHCLKNAMKIKIVATLMLLSVMKQLS